MLREIEITTDVNGMILDGYPAVFDITRESYVSEAGPIASHVEAEFFHMQLGGLSFTREMMEQMCGKGGLQDIEDYAAQQACDYPDLMAAE